MSEPAAHCSCRLPWIVTLIALGVLVAERFIASATTPSGKDIPSAITPAATPNPASDPRLTTLQHDLDETRRVLDDAQSALAQRDREIATANDELRVLRLELDALRAQKTAPAP
jgi:hypothetical protein